MTTHREQREDRFPQLSTNNLRCHSTYVPPIRRWLFGCSLSSACHRKQGIESYTRPDMIGSGPYWYSMSHLWTDWKLWFRRLILRSKPVRSTTESLVKFVKTEICRSKSWVISCYIVRNKPWLCIKRNALEKDFSWKKTNEAQIA